MKVIITKSLQRENKNTKKLYYDLSKKNCPSCLPEYLWFFCFDLSKLCEIRKQLEIIYPALLSISFYLYSFRNESVLKMHMHFGWEKNVHLLRYTGFVALPFTVIFFRFFFHYLFFHYVPSIPGKKEAIVILHKNGFSHRKIAKELSYDRQSSMSGIIKVAKKVWRAITTEYLKNLYESMPRRMAAVKGAGGRHTKY